MKTLPAVIAFALLLCGCAQLATSPNTPTPSAPSAAPSPTNAPLRFVVSFPTTTHSNSVTGRVLLFLSKSPGREPRFGGSFTDLLPVFAIDATNLAPNAPILFSPGKFTAPDALAFPVPLGRIEPGT